MGYLENGAITNAVTQLSTAFVRAVTLKRVDILAAIMGPAISPDQLAEIRKLASDSADALSGHSALSFLPAFEAKPPFRLRHVFAIKDKQKLNDIIEQKSKLMSGGLLADIGKKFGLKMQSDFKRNAEIYKDVPIDAIHITLEPIDVNSPQGRPLKAALGEGLNIRLAIVNDLFLYTLSADPEKDIHALIDQVKAGTPAPVPSEVQAAVKLIPEAKDAGVFGTYNYMAPSR